MINPDKKKRNTSGSRSKSRKSKPNDFSVELKPHKVSHTIISHEHTSKQKTQNSLNKSKGSRKHTKHGKKIKVSKNSKEISRSASAERKNSLMKMNKTQANYQYQDIEDKIYAIKKNLVRIQKPASLSTHQISNFYQEIHDSIDTISEPLYSLLHYFHDLYMSPINQIFEMIAPYQDLLKKKQMLSRSLQQQIKQNQQIYGKLKEQDLILIQLKQIIQEQKQQIDNKRKHTQQKMQKGMNSNNMKKQKNGINFNKNHIKQTGQGDAIKAGDGSEVQTKVNTKGLKINLNQLGKNDTLGFHDEFYAKIDEFSQSWRNQALRQKRF